jgi:antitoxin CptB
MLARTYLRGNRTGKHLGDSDIGKTSTDIRGLPAYIAFARHRPGFWRLPDRGGKGPMPGGAHSDDGLPVRRRKLLFRSWHRGMRELDLIMGRFADAVIAELSEQELGEFEQLLEVPDNELLAWVAYQTEVPADFDTALFRRLRDFNHGSERTS